MEQERRKEKRRSFCIRISLGILIRPPGGAGARTPRSQCPVESGRGGEVGSGRSGSWGPWAVGGSRPSGIGRRRWGRGHSENHGEGRKQLGIRFHQPTRNQGETNPPPKNTHNDFIDAKHTKHNAPYLGFEGGEQQQHSSWHSG